MDDPLIPGFEVLGKIGEGATATVWKARQLSLDRLVAIKLLRSEFAANPEEIELFAAEARRAAGLKHPNIVQIYDASELHGLPYFVMECVEGSSISESLRHGEPMAADHCMTIVRGVAQALQHGWQQTRIIHRDVNPANILLDRDGTVKLSDLGLAMQVQPGSQGSDLIEGTPGYMSPEQIEGKSDLGPGSDMYSLGATLYHMSTGSPPFSGAAYDDVMRSQLVDRIPNPRDLNARLPIGVMQLTTRLMMRSPENRYADWSRALRDIQTVSKRRPLIASVPDDASSSIRPATRPEQATRGMPLGSRTAAPVIWALVLAWWAWLTWALVGPSAEYGGDALASPKGAVTTPRNVPVHTDDVAATVATWLVRGDKDQASETLRQLIRDSTDAEDRHVMMEMQSIVEQLTAPDAMVAAALRRQVGETMLLRHLGKSRRLKLIRVEGNKVTASQSYRQEGVAMERNVSFDVSILSPEERVRWLTTRYGPAEACLKFILLLNSADAAGAAKAAPRCGPFSKAFQGMMGAMHDEEGS
jgi:serine/threonine-protein kinase